MEPADGCGTAKHPSGSDLIPDHPAAAHIGDCAEQRYQGLNRIATGAISPGCPVVENCLSHGTNVGADAGVGLGVRAVAVGCVAAPLPPTFKLAGPMPQINTPLRYIVTLVQSVNVALVASNE